MIVFVGAFGSYNEIVLTYMCHLYSGIEQCFITFSLLRMIDEDTFSAPLPSFKVTLGSACTSL